MVNINEPKDDVEFNVDEKLVILNGVVRIIIQEVAELSKRAHSLSNHCQQLELRVGLLEEESK